MLMAESLERVNVAYVSIRELEQYMPDFAQTLPDSVCQQAITFSKKRHREFLAGRWLLSTMLRHFYAVEALPEMFVGQNGKPGFDDRVLSRFSISHSGDFAMVAMAQGMEIGLDLEAIRTRNNCMALAKHYFSVKEYQFLTEQLPEVQFVWFWRLWTVRESILKFKAFSVWQMKDLLLDPRSFIIETTLLGQVQAISVTDQAFCWALTTETPCMIDQYKVDFSSVPVLVSASNIQTTLWQQ